jgi:hypothetical protein
MTWDKQKEFQVVYVVVYSNSFEEDWYIKRTFSSREKAQAYIDGHKGISQFAELEIEEQEVL